MMAPTHRAKAGEGNRGAATRRDDRRRHLPSGCGTAGRCAEVRFDGLAQALRCAKGGSSIQTLLVIDDVGMFARKITPREAARLMGLPEHYRLPEGVTAAHDLVGDGVCGPRRAVFRGASA